jgi:transcriptional regulator with XRE-family HTH domain
MSGLSTLSVSVILWTTKTAEKEGKWMRTPAHVIGQNVKALRENRGETAEELGARIGEIFGKPWPRQTVYLTEQGGRRFAAEEVVAFAFLFGVSIADLFVPSANVDEVQVGNQRIPRERLLTQGQQDSERLYEVARHAQALHRSIPEIFDVLRAQQMVVGDIDLALRGEPPWTPQKPSDDPAIRPLNTALRRHWEKAQEWYRPGQAGNAENR